MLFWVGSETNQHLSHSRVAVLPNVRADLTLEEQSLGTAKHWVVVVISDYPFSCSTELGGSRGIVGSKRNHAEN